MPASPDPLARAYHRSLGLRWLATVAPMPALVPLMLERGLGVAEIALVMAVFSLVTAALELPTGGLADAFGRVRTTLVADGLALAARVGMMLAPGLPVFLVAAALAGAARALGSGGLEAWYVDARRRRDPREALRAPLAHAGVVEAIALGIGTLGGGALTALGPVLGLGPAGGVAALQLPFLASALLGILAIWATARLGLHPSGPPLGRAEAHPLRVVGAAVATVRGDRGLLALLALAAAGGAAVLAFETFLPPTLADRLPDGMLTPILGAAMAAAFGATALGTALGGRWGRGDVATRTPAAVGFVLVAAGACAATVPLGAGAVVAVAGLLVAYLGLGIAGPTLATAFHERVPASRRAALLSARSLASYAGGVAASLLLGAVASSVGLDRAWLVVALAACSASVVAAVTAPPAPAGNHLRPDAPRTRAARRADRRPAAVPRRPRS